MPVTRPGKQGTLQGQSVMKVFVGLRRSPRAGERSYCLGSDKGKRRWPEESKMLVLREERNSPLVS